MSSLIIQYVWIFYISFGVIGAVGIIILNSITDRYNFDPRSLKALLLITVGFLFGTGFFLLLLSQELKQNLTESISMASITLAFFGIAIGLLSIPQSPQNQQPQTRRIIGFPFRNLIIILFFVITAFFCGYVSGIYDSQNMINRKYMEDFDEYLTINYGKNAQAILDSNNNEILNISSSNISDFAKLNLIADKVVNNFTNPWWDNGTNFWENEFDGSSLKYNHKYFGDVQGYGFDRNGRLRAMPGTKFFFNSSWIETQNTGACIELAVLFDDYAKKMGYESRIVHNPQVDHAWNEVNISGIWYYADVDCYHSRGAPNWIGLTKNYTDNCMCFPATSRIYIFPSEDLKDDISANYLKEYIYCPYFLSS